MADLHAITPEPLGEGMVERLEQALAMAHAGELSSVAIALVHRDGATGALWSSPPSTVLLLGSVARLAHKLNRALD